MERYIGLDVSRQSCTCAVMGPSGKRLREEVVETSGEALLRLIKSIPGTRHLCFEEGTQSLWLYELLKPHVHDLTVLGSEKSRGQKSDSVDAWSMCDRIRLGSVKTRVYKELGEFGSLREANRGYSFLTRDLARVKNRLQSIFRGRGLSPAEEIYDPATRQQWFAQLPARQKPVADLLGQQMDALAPLKMHAKKWLEAEAKKHAIVGRIATAPGMGLIRSAQVAAIVVTPHRFRTRAQFWAYCGLGLVMRSSADWERVGDQWIRAQVSKTRGLNRNRHPLLKAAFKGAATTVIQTKHPLHQVYERMLQSGTKPNLAKLTLARRIACIVLSMWKHEEDYDPKRQLNAKTE